jgi:hypothetical protein
MLDLKISINKSKTQVAKIILIFLSLISKILCQVLGASLQTELIIMNLLGAINSMWDWKKLNWTHQVEEITMMPLPLGMSYETILRTALTWIVIMRIIIAHLYTLTYIVNFYSILTWYREKLLFPWLAMSAIKNFLLEAIVLLIVGILYVEKKLPGFLVCEFVAHKIVTLVPAIYNWLTIHAFYKELQGNLNKKSNRITQFEFHQQISDSPNIILGMRMRTPKCIENYGSEAFSIFLGNTAL